MLLRVTSGSGEMCDVYCAAAMHVLVVLNASCAHLPSHEVYAACFEQLICMLEWYDSSEQVLVTHERVSLCCVCVLVCFIRLALVHIALYLRTVLPTCCAFTLQDTLV